MAPDDGSSSAAAAAAAPWLYVAPHTLRHDPSHLVSHRAVMDLAAFRDAVVAPVAAAAAAAAATAGAAGAAATAGAAAGGRWRLSEYGRMLLQMDEVVSHEVRGAWVCGRWGWVGWVCAGDGAGDGVWPYGGMAG